MQIQGSNQNSFRHVWWLLQAVYVSYPWPTYLFCRIHLLYTNLTFDLSQAIIIITNYNYEPFPTIELPKWQMCGCPSWHVVYTDTPNNLQGSLSVSTGHLPHPEASRSVSEIQSDAKWEKYKYQCRWSKNPVSLLRLLWLKSLHKVLW